MCLRVLVLEFDDWQKMTLTSSNYTLSVLCTINGWTGARTSDYFV